MFSSKDRNTRQVGSVVCHKFDFLNRRTKSSLSFVIISSAIDIMCKQMQSENMASNKHPLLKDSEEKKVHFRKFTAELYLYVPHSGCPSVRPVSPGMKSRRGRDFSHASWQALETSQAPVKPVPGLFPGNNGLNAEVKERVNLYLYSTSGPSWPAIGRHLPVPYKGYTYNWLSRNKHTVVLTFCFQLWHDRRMKSLTLGSGILPRRFSPRYF